MQGKITENFTWEEATKTRTGIDNSIPNDEIAENIKALVINVLQPLRDGLKRPIKINSIYRSPEVNAAIGGSKNSQHMVGEAADISCDVLLDAFNYIKDKLPFDQLIYEYGKHIHWIHVSYKRKGQNRKQILVAKTDKKTGQVTYIPFKE